MFNKSPRYLLTVTFGLLAGCNDGSDSNNSSQIVVPPTVSALELMLETLGGEDTLNNLLQIQYKAEGQSFEFQEQPEPVEELVNSFDYSLQATLDGVSLRKQWHIDFDYAFDMTYDFTEVIVGDQGVVADGINSFGAYAFGAFGAQADPMNSAKLAARQKTWFMSSPLAIVKNILENDDGDSTLVADFRGLSVTLTLDEQSNLPLSAQTLEFDPLYGDVVYEVEFHDWEAVGDSQYPHRLVHRLDGKLIREETLEEIEFVEIDEANFDFGEIEPNVVDSDKASNGFLSSQFYLRGLMIGFPFDALDENAIVSEFIDSEEKVLRITGTDHYTYAFLIEDQVHIYDAAINNERQRAILAEIALRFPDKPIASVILSHNHFDHAGGFRGALANGGDLIVGEGSVSFYQDLLARPHVLKENPLAQPESVTIQSVGDKLVLGQGNETLEVYAISEGHAQNKDMLVLYRPADKTLFFADLYNSGFVMLQGFFDNLAPTIKVRAQQLVEFVDTNQLDVQTIAPTHGDVWNDSNYDSVINAAF